MHILTKTFVLIAMLLGIALSMLTIAYAVNTDKVLQSFDAERSAKVAADSKVSLLNSTSASERQRLQDLINTLTSERDEAKKAVDLVKSENAELKVAKNRAESERQSVQNRLGELTETVKTQQNLLATYSGEVSGLRKNELAYKQRTLEMEDRLSDLESQKEVLEQNYRALQEQVAEFKRSGNSGTAVASAAGAAQPFVATSGPVINGRVDEVRTDSGTGRTLAKISVGTNDRVAKNQKFIVYRDQRFIGNIVVVQPDLASSVAEIQTLVGSTNDIRPGDLIISRVN